MIRIEPQNGWRFADWNEIVAYKELLWLLVCRDIKVMYHQTVFGIAWAIFRPLFQMVIFTIVFGRMANVSSNGAPYPLFSYVGLVPWTYFAAATPAAINSLIGNAGIITKVYFPRIFIPLTPVLAKLLDFAIGLFGAVILAMYYGMLPGRNLLWMPFLILIMVVTAAGVGLWLSALAVQYRDVKHASEFMIQLLLFVAPVVWPASLIRDNFGTTAYVLYGVYPMAGVIEGFRAALTAGTPMPLELLAVGTSSAAVVFVSGIFYFRRMERRYADVA